MRKTDESEIASILELELRVPRINHATGMAYEENGEEIVIVPEIVIQNSANDVRKDAFSREGETRFRKHDLRALLNEDCCSSCENKSKGEQIPSEMCSKKGTPMDGREQLGAKLQDPFNEDFKSSFLDHK